MYALSVWAVTAPSDPAAAPCTPARNLVVTLTSGGDAFNLTNKVNYANFVGTRGSPLFLQPISARSPRRSNSPRDSRSDADFNGIRAP